MAASSSQGFKNHYRHEQHYSCFSSRKRSETADSIPGRMQNPLFIEVELPCDGSQEVMSNRERACGSDVITIMCAELAIRRELAYRSNMGYLRTQSHQEFQLLPQPVPQSYQDIQQHTLPVQGAPSNDNTVAIQRMVPVTASCLLPGELGQSDCQLPLQTEPPNLFCEQCLVLCTSTSKLQEHYQGQKHRAKLEQLEHQKNGRIVVSNALACHMCNISCPDKFSLRMHLSGKKHASRFKASKCMNSAKRQKKFQLRHGNTWRRIVS